MGQLLSRPSIPTLGGRLALDSYRLTYEHHPSRSDVFGLLVLELDFYQNVGSCSQGGCHAHTDVLRFGSERQRLAWPPRLALLARWHLIKNYVLNSPGKYVTAAQIKRLKHLAVCCTTSQLFTLNLDLTVKVKPPVCLL